MSESPNSRMFGLAAMLTWAKSRLACAHVLVFLVVALIFCVWCETATAQTTVVRGRFILNVGAGFTQPQIDSFTRAVEYWAELSPEGPDFIYSVALGDLGAPDPVTGGFVVASTSRTGVIFNNNAALNLDALYTTAANTQLKQLPGTAQLNWEDILIHEIGHPMGFWGDTAWNPATGELVGFADTVNHYTTLLRDRNGTWGAPGLQFTNPGAPNYFNPAEVTFWGEEAMRIYGDEWAGGNPEAVPMFPGTRAGSSLSHIDERIALQFWLTQSDTRPFYSEVELAIFNDANDPNLPDNIDIRNFFGRSFYQTHAGVITVDNDGNPFDLSGRFGVGLHLVAGGNTIVLDTDIITRGYAGAGIRIENNDNTVIINEGVRISANGENGVGVLMTHNLLLPGSTSIYGGSSLLNQGRIDATGTGGTGVYINVMGDLDGLWWGHNDNVVFDNSGIINAGAGNNAIYISGNGGIGNYGYYPDPGTGINFMRGTTITGSIVNHPNNYWVALTFGKLAGADGFATYASDPGDFLITIDGGLVGMYDFETWGGHTIITQDLAIPTSWFWIGYGTENSTLELRGNVDTGGSGLIHVLPNGTLVAAGGAAGGTTTFNIGNVLVYGGGTISPSVSTNDLGRLTIRSDYGFSILYGSLFQMDNGSTLRVDLGTNNNSDRITVVGQNYVDPETGEVIAYNTSIGAIVIDLTTVLTGNFILVQAQTAGTLNYSPASVANTTVLTNGAPITLFGRKTATVTPSNFNDTEVRLDVIVTNTGTLGNYHLTWTGAVDGRTWDIQNTENWRDNSAFAVWFEDGDAVTFGLSGTNTINIDTGTGGVLVGDMFVTGEGDWTFNGDITGEVRQIIDIGTGTTTPSSGGLFMDGTGSITLNGINSFAGDINLQGGRRVVDTITHSRTILDGEDYELATSGNINIGTTGYGALDLRNGAEARAGINVHIGSMIEPGQDSAGLLTGNGILRASNVYVYETGMLIPGDPMAPFDTLTVVGNLFMFDNSTLQVNLGTAGQTSSVNVLGTAQIGEININLSSLFLDGTFFTGEFTLVSSHGLDYQNDSATLWFNGREIPLTIGRWTVLDAQTTNTGTNLELTLDGAINNYYLYWTGLEDNTTWDFETENWLGYNPDNMAELDTRFVDGDSVSFSDWFLDYAGGTTTINIVGEKVIVADMRVEGSGNWIFNGNIHASARPEHTTIPDAAGMLLMDSYSIWYGTYNTLTVTLNGDNLFEGGGEMNGGTLNINGDTMFGGSGIFVYGGEVFVGDGGETGTIAGNIYLYNTAPVAGSGIARITFNRSDDSAFTDNISGDGSLTKKGGGALALLGNNTYTGLTLIEQGGLIFGSERNSIGAVEIRTDAILSGIGEETEISTVGAVVNNSGRIEDLGDLLIGGSLTNTGGIIHNIAGTLRASEITNTEGSIFGIGAIEVSRITGGGAWNIVENPDGTVEYTWIPATTSGEWTGDWVYDAVDGKYWNREDILNPDGTYTYIFVEAPEGAVTDWGPYLLDLQYTPHGKEFGNFVNNAESYVGHVGSLEAMNVTNHGDMESVGAATAHNTFANYGYFGDFGTLTASNANNFGTIVGLDKEEDEAGFSSEVHIANALTNSSGQIGRLKELTAATVNNTGGVIGDVDTMLVGSFDEDGEFIGGALSNRNNTTTEGTMFGIGNLRAGSVLNEGAMSGIGTMDVDEEVVNLNLMANIGSMSVGSDIANSGFLGNINTLTVGGNIFNEGVFVNVGSLTIGSPDLEEGDVSIFINRYAAVVGGITRFNLNGGTFYNQGGIIIVGESDLDALAANQSVDTWLKSMERITIDGDFVSENGLFVLGLDDRSTGAPTNSVIEVTGTATLDGGIVYIVVNRDMHYVATNSDYRYVFLETGEGLNVEGLLEMASVNDPLLQPVARYDDSQYWFFLERTFLYSGEGETQNQRAIGRYLDQVGIYPNADYRNVLMALDHTLAGFADPFAAALALAASTAEEELEMTALASNPAPTATTPTPAGLAGRGDPIHRALDQMSGSIYGTITSATFQNTVMFHATLTNVLRRDYNDVGGVYDQIYRGQPQRPRSQRPIYGNRGIYNPTNNVWGMLYGHGGTMHSDGNAGKYKQEFFGVMAGFDRINERRVRMGLFLSMGEGRLNGDLQDKTVSREFMAGHYYRRDGDHAYLLVQAGLGVNRYDTKRDISFGGYNPASKEFHFIDRTAKNSHNAFLATAHLETGLRYRGGILNLSPFTALQYTGLLRESFTERGADSLNLTAGSATYNSLRVMFGMRFDTEAVRFRRGLASFYGNVAWMYEFEPTGRHSEFSARFSDAGLLSGTPRFTVYGNDPGRDWVQAGFGVKHDVHAHLRLFIGYDAYANTQQVMHSGGMGFVWEL